VVHSTAERESVDRIAHLTSIAIDRRAVDDRLRHQALHDSLTGLPNRQQLLSRVSAMSDGEGGAVDGDDAGAEDPATGGPPAAASP